MAILGIYVRFQGGRCFVFCILHFQLLINPNETNSLTRQSRIFAFRKMDDATDSRFPSLMIYFHSYRTWEFPCPLLSSLDHGSGSEPEHTSSGSIQFCICICTKVYRFVQTYIRTYTHMYTLNKKEYQSTTHHQEYVESFDGKTWCIYQKNPAIFCGWKNEKKTV